jgi:hypothetical protein
MIYRRERPVTRKTIIRLCTKNNWTLTDLMNQERIHLTAPFKTQIRLMLEEQRQQETYDSLTFEFVDGESLPVFYCDEEKNGDLIRWSFWCPYCKIKHYHSPHEGIRFAHCSKDSVFSENGYILKLKQERKEDGFLMKRNIKNGKQKDMKVDEDG